MCKDCCKVRSLTRHRINRWRTITHISSSRPHILAVFFVKREVYHWFGRLSTRIRWKRSWKMNLFKTLNRVEIFENIGFSFNCERPKREDFEHHILLPLCMLLKNAIVISIFLAIFFLVDGRKWFEWGMRGPAFFDNGEKISLFKIYPDSCGGSLGNFFTGSRLFKRWKQNKRKKNYLNMEVQILTISLAILKKSSVVINWSRTRVLVRELKVIHVI